MQRPSISWIVLFGLIAACSASNRSTEFSSGSESSGAGATGSGSGTGGVGISTTASGPSTGTSMGCSVAAEYVYVLSEENDLYSFEPDKKMFHKIGPLQCQTSMQPNSMAVDRNAVAWVNYVESDGLGTDTAGSVFKVSTSDASCQPTNIQLPQSWYRLGMGFSTDMAGGTAEQLYVTGTGAIGTPTSPGLGKIDLGTQQLQPIGQFTGALTGQSAELTGTGDARLFGFFTTTPVQVAELDKGSGAVMNPKSLQVETPAAWAFSFWGGDFYLYTCPDPTTNPTRTTNVTKYSPGSGMVDASYMTNIGFIIVGAGVSTCAPVVPPN